MKIKGIEAFGVPIAGPVLLHKVPENLLGSLSDIGKLLTTGNGHPCARTDHDHIRVIDPLSKLITYI